MFETLYLSDATRELHRVGPFATERERYLRHCADQGSTRATLRLRAPALLWVAARMSPTDRDGVDTARLDQIVHALPLPASINAETRMQFARRWLQFLGWWREAQQPIPFEQQLGRFVSWMRDERGLTPCTVDQWRRRAVTFLRWCGGTGRTLATLRPDDIDAYFITFVGGFQVVRRSGFWSAPG